MVRFGLLWKIFDLVGLRIPEFQVPILAPREADLGPCYLWGAVSGTDCLLAPFGLDQPKAGKEKEKVVDRLRTEELLSRRVRLTHFQPTTISVDEESSIARLIEKNLPLMPPFSRLPTVFHDTDGILPHLMTLSQ